jgi:hypothetical protein
VLAEAKKARTGEFVFPGSGAARPLSVMAMEMVLRRMHLDVLTVHGFRSAFRDWAGNETHFLREVTEAALAHVIGDGLSTGDALEKRRALMEAWARFLEPSTRGNVVNLPARG